MSILMRDKELSLTLAYGSGLLYSRHSPTQTYLPQFVSDYRDIQLSLRKWQNCVSFWILKIVKIFSIAV